MKLFLFILAFQLTLVSARSSSNVKSKSYGKNECSAIKAPTGPYCQSLVAYVVGTFQSKDAQTPSFSAEFQVRLDADLKKKRITINADQWNENYANSSDFYLDFYYETNQQWCDIREEDCSASFARNVTNFKLDLNKQDGSSFFHLLYFDYFNNSFALTKANGQCTKHQLDGINDEWTPNLDELSICVCCDEYNPNKLLFCPEDPWKGITSGPGATTVKPAPPPSGNITCKSIVAYYNGIFKNNHNTTDAMSVEFQMRMYADSRNYYAEIDHWNRDKTKASDIQLYVVDSSDWNYCDPPINNNCSNSYSSQDDIWLNIDHYINGNYLNFYQFSYFPAFNGQFTLYNVVDGCTKFQQKSYIDQQFAVDQNSFDFCMCCGDTYSPEESLGCPVNPWA